ncbi:MAG TPA: OmpH family outer membrane protein [Bryobacteraceae bacterium]|nr:OmpH family outer membrane protein [Bryobacteraceae bacterium]
MTNRIAVLAALALGIPIAAVAQTAVPTKVGIINIQAALVNTREGQKAQSELQARTAPRQKELEKRKGEIDAMREQLNRMSNAGSPEQKEKLMRDIDAKTKAFNRDVEDAQADLDQEQGRVLNELGGKMMKIIEQYARDNNYAVILDVSNQQTPVIWASSAVEITKDIVEAYDKAVPAPAATGGTGTTPPPTSGAKPAVPATKPAVPATKPPIGGGAVKPLAPKPGTVK